MSTFKKVVKDFEEEGKVLFYYRKDENFIETIGINKHGNDDFGYWIDYASPENVDFSNIEDSLFHLYYYTDYHDTQGFSCRSTLEDVVEDTIEYVPNIRQDIKQLDSEMTVF